MITCLNDSGMTSRNWMRVEVSLSPGSLSKLMCHCVLHPFLSTPHLYRYTYTVAATVLYKFIIETFLVIYVLEANEIEIAVYVNYSSTSQLKDINDDIKGY